MTAYRRGDTFEKRVMAQLETDGYWVGQSRGSKTVVDMVAIKRDQVLFIQVKSGKRMISAAEWNALYATALKVDAVPILAVRQYTPAGVPSPKPPVYWLLTGRRHPHRPTARDWPAEAWSPDEVAEAMARHPAGKARLRPVE